MFPYENINKKIDEFGQPSQATFRDLENCEWEKLPGTFGDYEASKKFAEIERIIGRHNRVDILHLDSAFKSRCSCFMTRDKDDVLSHRDPLHKLLGIHFFHTDIEWSNFLAFIGTNQRY